MPSTAKPKRRPSARSVSTVPAALCPYVKFSPTTTWAACSCSTSTVWVNVSGDSRLNSSVNGSTHIASTPSSATSSALRSSDVRIAGCEPGRTTSAGCGSKVSSRHGRRIACARATAAPISFWCPRWTPSYMPTVTTVRPRSPGVASMPRQRSTGRSGALGQPAGGVAPPPVLDVEELLAQRHRGRPGLAVGDHEVPGARLDLADRRDPRGGAAREGLGDRAVGDAGPPLVDREAPLGDRVAHLAGQGDQRVSGDAGQQGAGQLRGHQLGVVAGAEDEEQVHPAHLLDVALLRRVEPHDLVAAGLDGLLLRQQARGVVAGALDVAGAAGRGPDVVLGQ